MRYKFTLILFCTTLFGSAQVKHEDIIGTWVKISGRMKDGSAIIIPAHKDSKYLEITIDRSSIGRNSDMVQRMNSTMAYTLDGNFLKTSASSGYILNQISADTISICENFEGVTDDKLTCFKLVRESKWLAEKLKKFDSTVDLVASEQLTPRLNSSFATGIFKELLGKLYNYRVAGDIILDLRSKTISAKPIDPKTDDKVWRVIKKHIEKSYDRFDLVKFNNFETITIPFVFETVRSGRYHGVDVKYFTHNVNDFDVREGGPKTNLIDHNAYSKRAAQAFADGKFIKAADLFSKAYEENPYDLDHLYNKAASLFQGGDKVGACTVWKQLMDLDQVNGKKMFETYCK